MLRKALGALAIVAGLLGCSEDQDSEENAPFASKAGVLREMGMFGRLLIVDAPYYGQDKVNGSPFFPTGQKDSPVTDCETGSVISFDATKRRQFDYLPTNRDQATYSQYDFSSCAKVSPVDPSVSYSQGGRLEIGDLGPNDPTDLSDGYHHYVQFGEGDYAFSYARLVRNDAGEIIERFVEAAGGSIEWSNLDYGTESGASIRRFVRRFEPREYLLAYQQGTDEQPLRSRLSLGGELLTVWGPVSYSVSECDIRQRVLATGDIGVTFLDGYLSSGGFTLDVEHEKVRVTLDGEGADIELPNGNIVRVSAQEVRDAMDAPLFNIDDLCR